VRICTRAIPWRLQFVIISFRLFRQRNRRATNRGDSFPNAISESRMRTRSLMSLSFSCPLYVRLHRVLREKDARSRFSAFAGRGEFERAFARRGRISRVTKQLAREGCCGIGGQVGKALGALHGGRRGMRIDSSCAAAEYSCRFRRADKYRRAVFHGYAIPEKIR